MRQKNNNNKSYDYSKDPLNSNNKKDNDTEKDDVPDNGTGTGVSKYEKETNNSMFKIHGNRTMKAAGSTAPKNYSKNIDNKSKKTIDWLKKYRKKD